MKNDIDDEKKTMIAEIDEVHQDKKGKECPITGHKSMSDQIHVILQPLDRNWKKQHWFIYDSKFMKSTAFKIVEQFAELGVIDLDDLPDNNLKIYKKIKENSKHDAFVFEERMIAKSKKPKWFPIEKK